jgi:hypothetical protein
MVEKSATMHSKHLTCRHEKWIELLAMGSDKMSELLVMGFGRIHELLVM